MAEPVTVAELIRGFVSLSRFRASTRRPAGASQRGDFFGRLRETVLGSTPDDVPPERIYDERVSSANAPDRMLDPICDMIVVVAEAQANGRTVEYDGRTYAFCSNGCVKAFKADPLKWAAKVDAAVTAVQTLTGDAAIDDGMRRWYAACRCCLSDAYPAIAAQLDAERDAAAAQ